MKRSFSVFILFIFFGGSIFAASNTPVITGAKSDLPLPPFPRIISASSENQDLPSVAVNINEADIETS